MKFSFLILILLSFLGIFAQDRASNRSSSLVDKSTDLLIGMNWQGNGDDKKLSRFYEIGIAKGRYKNTELGTSGTAIYASEEIYFGKDGNIYGTKVGAWTHQFLDFGIAAIYYTDFDRGNFKLRPEIGFGLNRVRAAFGYNIPTIDNRAFTRLEKHDFQISIQTTVSLHKKL